MELPSANIFHDLINCSEYLKTRAEKAEAELAPLLDRVKKAEDEIEGKYEQRYLWLEEVYDNIRDMLGVEDTDATFEDGLVVEKLASLQAELAAERESRRWIPCGERMPEMSPFTETPEFQYSANCLILINGKVIRRAYYDTSVDEWVCLENAKLFGEDEKVTHWQRLPSAPEADK